MARITVEDCIDKFESRFELVLVASNRARKLHSGENPTIERDNDKNTVIALREIADETIEIDKMKNNLIEEFQTVSIQNEEDLSLEYEETDAPEIQDVDDSSETEINSQNNEVFEDEETQNQKLNEEMISDSPIDQEDDSQLIETSENS